MADAPSHVKPRNGSHGLGLAERPRPAPKPSQSHEAETGRRTSLSLPSKGADPGPPQPFSCKRDGFWGPEGPTITLLDPAELTRRWGEAMPLVAVLCGVYKGRRVHLRPKGA
jgi:hypothetical protein